MTGGGLLTLVAYGQQNVLLSGNPQMTYFYKAFRRYSHFSMENVTTALEGPQELSYDQSIRLRYKIQRIGDLVSDMYFTFRIPDIYSKYIPPSGPLNIQQEFQWVRYLGAALIQNAAFFVGGQKIQEFDGTYIMSRALLDYDKDKLQKWKNLVGDVPELNDPANGLYAGGLVNQGYPSVLSNSQITTAQFNRPSIFGRDIHVPLPFWFTDNTSQSLPLVGLQYHDCEVQLTLNPIQQLYTTLDASGYRVAPGYFVNSQLSNIYQNIPNYANLPDISGVTLNNFLVDIGYTRPNFNNWPLYPRLQTTYIYLTDQDRKVFASSPLSYLYQEVTLYPFLGLYNRQLLDVEAHNPISRLLFITRRSDTIYRNDFGNLTNWYNYPAPPFLPTPAVSTYLSNYASSGLLLPQGQLDTIRNLRVLCDGNEIQQEKPVDFFTRITPFRNLTGDSEDLIPVYSFSLHSPTTQPAGSINASRIKNFQVEVDVYPLPQNTTYTYNLYLYVESYNFFEVAAGLGGKKYAL
jgi:Major capsid protein N-terminus/Large eukaryotic DNA virus major capsid protein